MSRTKEEMEADIDRMVLQRNVQITKKIYKEEIAKCGSMLVDHPDIIDKMILAAKNKQNFICFENKNFSNCLKQVKNKYNGCNTNGVITSDFIVTRNKTLDKFCENDEYCISWK